MNWLKSAADAADTAQAEIDETKNVWVMPDEENINGVETFVGWTLADPESGYPVLGEFSNQYRNFETKKAAVEFVKKAGYKPVFG